MDKRTMGRFQVVSRFCLVVILPILLSACGFQPQALSNGSRFKTVAVVSLLPATVTFWHKGITVFQNHGAVFPLTWNPNKFTYNVAQSILRKRYNIVKLHIDKQKIVQNIHDAHSSAFIIHTGRMISSALKKMVKPGSADIIIVMDATAFNKDGYAGRYTAGDGLGINGQPFDRYSSIATYANFEIFDGDTFKEIALTFSDPSLPLKIQWFGAPYENFSPNQKRRIYKAEHKSLYNYVLYSLQTNHLSQ